MRKLKRLAVAFVLAAALSALLVSAAQVNADETVYVTRTGKKYHAAGCRYLKSSQYAMKLKDAVAADYSPCSVCNPPRLDVSASEQEVETSTQSAQTSSSAGGARNADTPHAQETKTTPKRARAARAVHPAVVTPALAAAAKQFVATGCDDSLWQHVYHPQRLRVVEKCIVVTGTVHHVKREADGDDHIQLTLDPQFAGLLNDRNKTAQADCLILEPICANPVTQTDAIPACRDFHSSVELPPRGTHVQVLGSYVLDTERPGHGWMEIHPVTSIEAVQ